MEYTQKYIKNFGRIYLGILGLVGGIYAAFVSAGNTAMIDYYCIGSVYAACPVYVTLAQVFLVSFAVCCLFFAFVLVFDFSAYSVIKFCNSQFTKNVLNPNSQREVKITIVPVLVENEILIAIRNDEFFLRSDDVVVNSKFYAPDNRKINKNIKWFRGDSEKTFIDPKKYKSLHLATITDNKLIVHFSDSDEEFSFPNSANSFYTIPLYITGFTSFFGYKINKVTFPPMNEVLIYNSKELNFRFGHFGYGF